MESHEYTLMDAAEGEMWWYRALHARLLDQLVGVHDNILDAGCGTGGFLMRLREDSPTVRGFGCERTESAARRATDKSGAPVACGTVTALPFVAGSFGAVVAADVLCHAEVPPRSALAEFRRVLRPGGCLIINMPAYQWLWSEHDRRVHNVRRSTARSLRTMLAASGFDDIRVRYWNSILLPLMVVQRKILRSRISDRSDVRPFPGWLNAMLYGVLAVERQLPFSMPFGGSVMAKALKPSSTPYGT